MCSHHYRELGPKPKREEIDALKLKLRKDLPDYWHPLSELYSCEHEAAFIKLQVRCCTDVRYLVDHEFTNL